MSQELLLSLIIACVGFFVLVSAFIWFNRKQRFETPPPHIDKLPAQEIPNDKLILVTHGDHENLKRVLLEFCRNNNEMTVKVIPSVNKISDHDFAITFPYEIGFDTFCYLVNYLVYPIDIEWHPIVTAWATVKPIDDWKTERTVNKKVMLFINVDDSDYDHIMLTTNDNIGYKLGFASGHYKELLDSPIKEYMSPPAVASRLSRSQAEVIQ